jgi:hypothetical protein
MSVPDRLSASYRPSGHGLPASLNDNLKQNSCEVNWQQFEKKRRQAAAAAGAMS